MTLIIQKFGGTSLATVERIKEVANIIEKAKIKGDQLIIVVSAMAGVTNQLISLCHEVSELKDLAVFAEYDSTVAAGEMVSAGLLALALLEKKIPARSVSAWQLPITTNANYNESLVKQINCELLSECLRNNIMPIVTGFQGITSDQRITTLGRGGSDTTALLIAAAMKSHYCDIYTDVTGVFSVDPRIIHYAMKLDILNIHEMLELAAGGAKVLHPRSVEIAIRYNIDIRVLSSFVEGKGTLITNDKIMESRLITGISYNKNLFKLIIFQSENNIEQVIEALVEKNILIESIFNLSENDYEFIISLNNKILVNQILTKLSDQKIILGYKIDIDISIISLVGYGIKNDIPISAQIFKMLKSININILRVIISEIKITIMLSNKDTELAVKKLHELIV